MLHDTDWMDAPDHGDGRPTDLVWSVGLRGGGRGKEGSCAFAGCSAAVPFRAMDVRGHCNAIHADGNDRVPEEWDTCIWRHCGVYMLIGERCKGCDVLWADGTKLIPGRGPWGDSKPPVNARPPAGAHWECPSALCLGQVPSAPFCGPPPLCDACAGAVRRSVHGDPRWLGNRRIRTAPCHSMPTNGVPRTRSPASTHPVAPVRRGGQTPRGALLRLESASALPALNTGCLGTPSVLPPAVLRSQGA